MHDLRSASGNRRATVITAVDLSPRVDQGGHDANEHVWYDFATMRSLADRLVVALSRDDPHHAAAFRSNARRFVTGLDRLGAKVGHIRASSAGDGVAVTEPVPDYLIDAAGLANRTPPGFSDAVENGTGVPPKVLADTLALFEHHRVRALVENAQTAGPATTRVLAAAHEYHVPVVPVTETLPRGDTYLSWMGANVDALARALD